MALLKKKTRKRVTKQLRKLVKKHGEDVITGLVATAAAAVATKSSGDTPKKPKAATARTHSDDMTQPKKQKTVKRSKSTAHLGALRPKSLAGFIDEKPSSGRRSGSLPERRPFG